MNTDIENKRCFICGEYNADSKDHIPPKNIYLKKYKSIGNDLISVPAHTKCNKKYEKDDEYFRYCLLIPAYWTNKVARELWDTKIKKQIHRKESFRFRKYLLDNIIPIDINSKGGIFLGKAQAALLDSKRMDRVLERIARGLFYSIKKYILPIDHPVEVQMLVPEYAQTQMKRFNVESNLISFCNKTFQYYWQQTIDNENKGLFWFVFFESVYFWIFI